MLKEGGNIVSCENSFSEVAGKGTEQKISRNTDIQIEINRCNLVAAMGYSKHALNIYEDLIQKNKQEPEVVARLYLERGKMQQSLGKYHDAVKDFKRALEYDPTNFDTHILYATVCEDTGRIQSARESVDAAIKLDQTNPIGYVIRARLNFCGAKRDKAIWQSVKSDLETALKLGSGDTSNTGEDRDLKVPDKEKKSYMPINWKGVQGVLQDILDIKDTIDNYMPTAPKVNFVPG